MPTTGECAGVELFSIVLGTVVLWGGLVFAVCTYGAYQQGITPTAMSLALLFVKLVAFGAFMGLILWTITEFRYRRYLKRYPVSPAAD